MTQDDLRRALNALGRIPVERVEEIMQAERDGRCVVLPCKVGDTLWFETFKRNATVCIGIQPHKVEQICTTYTVDEWTDIPDWEIGKTVFLTRALAEEVLKDEQKKLQ